MKSKEKIESIAHKLMELEKTQNIPEMEKLVSTLSIEEMLEIDEYIMTKLLTK